MLDFSLSRASPVEPEAGLGHEFTESGDEIVSHCSTLRNEIDEGTYFPTFPSLFPLSQPHSFMANTKSAAKRARQTIRRTAVNRRDTRKLKLALKSVEDQFKVGDKTKATEAARTAISALDSCAKKGRIHKNKANRHKARIARALSGLAKA